MCFPDILVSLTGWQDPRKYLLELGTGIAEWVGVRLEKIWTCRTKEGCHSKWSAIDRKVRLRD